MTQKILFISYDGMTDPLGQSQVIPYLQGLSKKGFKIFILSCEKKQAFAQNENSVKRILSAAEIVWIPIAYTKKPPVLSTIKDIINLKRKAKQIHRKYGIDMVHTRPGIPALVGMWMKKKMDVKFLHDIREFYADSRVDGGIWNMSNPLFKIIYSYFKKKELEQFETCDGIVCLTYAAKNIIQAVPGLEKEKPLSVIPCSADLNLFNPETISDEFKRQLKFELGISENDIVISYLGSVGGWYLTSEMLRFCKLITTKMPAAKFLFISPDKHDMIAMEAAKYDLPEDKLIVISGTRKEVPALLSLSSFSLFFIKPCISKLSSSPTKHGEIMAMGIPVIANSGVGDVKEIIEKYKAGFVVDDFTDTTFARVVDMLAAPHFFDAAAIRNAAADFYSLEKATELYADMYNQILLNTTAEKINRPDPLSALADVHS